MTSIQSVPQLEAESLAFFDPERNVFGVAGPQVSVLFSGRGTTRKMGFAVSETPQLTTLSASHWKADMQSVEGSFDLEFKSREGCTAHLDSSEVTACSVSGRVTEAGKRERRHSSVGVATLPSRRGGPPVLRSIAAVFENGDCFFMNAYRPAVYHGLAGVVARGR
jgi:hypothetical protein